MKIFVDDLRDPPDTSWVICRTVAPVLELIDTCLYRIEIFSLDHDLADFSGPDGRELTGYTIMQHLERLANVSLEHAKNGFEPIYIPTVLIHSQNSVGIDKMLQGLRNIRKIEQDTKTIYSNRVRDY